MGGKSSKESTFRRATSFRRSQKNTFQRIQKKLEKVTKDIDSFSGTNQDESYHKIKKSLTEIINSLDEISSTVKDKHKDTYQDILDNCFDELNKLDSKLEEVTPPANDEEHRTSAPASVLLPSPFSSPLSNRSTQSVQVNFVTITPDVDDKKKYKKNKKKQLMKEESPSTSSQEISTKDKMQEDSVETIHQLRKQIEYLEGEIYTYKQEKDEVLYGYIKENLTQILFKVDNLETYGNMQIKHERKLALQRAQDCLKLLNDNAVRGPAAMKSHRLTSVIPKNVLSEMRNSSKFRNLERKNTKDDDDDDEVDSSVVEVKQPTKQVTFEINANDQLRDELYKIIHERIEDASSEPEPDEKPVDVKKVRETFSNTDSEDDYDFVNVDGDNDDAKQPVLITSF